MELMEIIKKRKSIRAYQDKPLSKDIVNDILEAARHAPTARNQQELEYRVITNRELITRCSEAITRALEQENLSMKTPPNFRPNFFYNAPLLILIIGPKDNHWINSDAALAVQNVMLYATSIGLGSCFIGMARFIMKDKELCQELHISEDKDLAAAVICGHAAEDPEPKEKRLNAEYFE